jgi:hypothetical protein
MIIKVYREDKVECPECDYIKDWSIKSAPTGVPYTSANQEIRFRIHAKAKQIPQVAKALHDIAGERGEITYQDKPIPSGLPAIAAFLKQAFKERKEKFSKVGKRVGAKGKSHERRVAQELREWTGDKEIQRTPNSGGFNKSSKTTVGEREFASDIMAKRVLAFTVEAKSQVGFNLDAVLAQQDGNAFTSWWFQANYDAGRVGKLPFLWFKPHPNFDWVALTYEGCVRLGLIDLKIPYIYVNAYGREVVCEISLAQGGRSKHHMLLPNAYLFRWKDIKKYANPDQFFEGESDGLQHMREQVGQGSTSGPDDQPGAEKHSA